MVVVGRWECSNVVVFVFGLDGLDCAALDCTVLMNFRAQKYMYTTRCSGYCGGTHQSVIATSRVFTIVADVNQRSLV